MSGMEDVGILFFTCVSSPGQEAGARMLVESIRDFGGDLPIKVFVEENLQEVHSTFEKERVDVCSLGIPQALNETWYAAKVAACAAAEEQAPGHVNSLVWISPDTLILNPPELLCLDPGMDAAVRPVHIRNIGLLLEQPLDAFWKNVHQQVGVDRSSLQVKSFVDEQLLSPYFNSHLVAVRPGRRIFQDWLKYFTLLAQNRAFQAVCSDSLHRIFLHQAVLSVLLADRVEEGRLRILPPEYSYPYNLHAKIPAPKQAQILNDLVCAAVEERSLDPHTMVDIEVREPLRSWLKRRTESSDS